MIIFPNGRTFPKRCTRCSRPAVNLAQTLCREHDGPPRPIQFGNATVPTDNCSSCAAVLEFVREFATLCHRCGDAHNADCADPDEGEEER